MDKEFIIETPLMWLNKSETWALADQYQALDMIKNETLTCYNGIVGDGCGDCPSCDLRRAGLMDYIANKNTISASLKEKQCCEVA